MLSDWERVAGLPEECFATLPQTEDERRELLVRERRARHVVGAPVRRDDVAREATVGLAAEQADRLLAELPAIDVLVLGMGDDGHTASLFPDSPNLSQALQPDGTRRCWPMLAPTVPHQRLTMSRALLATANYTVLSISGSSKLTTLSAALASDDVAAMPIRAFLQPTLEIYWCP